MYSVVNLLPIPQTKKPATEGLDDINGIPITK